MKTILSTLFLLLSALMPTTLWAQELAGDEAIEPYAVLSEENTKLTFYYDEKKAERNGMDVGPFEYASERWGGHHTEITSIVFDESFANYYPNSTAYWFRSCQKLTSLENMQYLNTDSVKSMLNMFYDCGSLEELDLSHFETSKVTNLFEMFTYCGKLKTLNLSSFNTSMVSNMASMFYGCSNLTTIYVGDQWTTVAVTDGGYTFFGCDNLVGGSGTHYDSEHADYTYARIDGGPTSETPGYFTRSGNEPYTVLEPYAVLSEENTKLTFYYDDKKTERNGMSVGPFEINSERLSCLPTRLPIAQA
jgi:surface protein